MTTVSKKRSTVAPPRETTIAVEFDSPERLGLELVRDALRAYHQATRLKNVADKRMDAAPAVKDHVSGVKDWRWFEGDNGP